MINVDFEFGIFIYLFVDLVLRILVSYPRAIRVIFVLKYGVLIKIAPQFLMHLKREYSVS